MQPFEISQNALARAMGVSPRRINEIVQGRRRITAATAVGLEVAVGPTAEFWMAMQADYDIALARRAEAHRVRKQLPDWSEPFDEPKDARPKYADWRFGY